MRRIERAQPDAPRLGVSNDRSRERLCITQPADMGFASREIASIVQRPTQVLIQARHFGMFAPYGPLPIHVTEHARTEVIAGVIRRSSSLSASSASASPYCITGPGRS